MQSKLEKEVRFLKIYAIAATLVCAVIMLSAFTFQTKNQKFGEIDVERINVVEKDGKLKMVISNKERQHPGTMDGKTYDERKGQRPAGMIFFSERGDEIGGLVYDGDTGKGQEGSLTFDRFRGDQTIQLFSEEKPDGKYQSGLRMNDQYSPMAEAMAARAAMNKMPTAAERTAAIKEMSDKGMLDHNRLEIGRGYDSSSFIKLKDAQGRARIAISVQPDGNPTINFLDENGKVYYILPENSSTRK